MSQHLILLIDPDHAPFISPKFNANAYANTILAGEPYDPEAQIPAPPVEQESSTVLHDATEEADGGAFLSGSLNVEGDVGLALARLDYGIVTDKHDILLDHLSESTTLSTNLSTVRTSLFQLDTSLNKLQTKIHTPYVTLQSEVSRLEKARTASELLRRAGRFLVLARRLETQMGFVTKPATPATATPNIQQKTDSPNPNRTPTLRPGHEPGSPKPEGEEEGEREREMLKAALTIAELGEFTISEAACVILRKGCAPEDTLLGTSTDDQPATGESDALPTDVPLESLDFVAQQAPVIARSKETIISEMENMVVQGLANLTAYNMRLLPQLVQNLLADLNDAVESRIAKAFDMTSIGKEVAAREQQSHTPASAASSLLYRTTRGKHAAETAPSNQTIGTWTQVLWKRMDMLIEDISQCCIKVYTLEKVLRRKKDAATQVDFLMEAMKSFSTGYPKLLRLFHDFFAKIAIHTDTVYSQEYQSPETILILRSVGTFEKLYLARTTNRINEAVNASFAGGPRQPPGATDGVTVGRIMVNELDAARIDPLLSWSVSRVVAKTMEYIVSRSETLIAKDFSATSLIGPLATGGQLMNSSVISYLYQLVSNLEYSLPGFAPKMQEILKPSMEAGIKVYTRATDALNAAFKREIGNIIARMHRVDFSKPVDPMSMAGGSGGSPYIKDLADKLNFIRLELLNRMSLGDFMKEWVLSIVSFVINTFLLHASITRPLGESGKLKLTGDMTELEFALGIFLTTGTVQGQRNTMRLEMAGDAYKALRTFRTCLFLDNASLSHPEETSGLPTLILLHHIIVLSPLQLPHQIHEWSETEYALWVDKHTPEESWRLLEKAVDGQREGQGAQEWRSLIREVLEHAREHGEQK
ncbi:hypothetical protein QFC20_001968 [Naganishia adeliensis]|uniref:Uncharacterized protein n=1 Tax=Naganishia adeliensis TaxID=92952 RepID=A0ACC2WQH7_9TREE|nr:hypothetical protein QFC20_001968 [Naganishia adeliensis]